MSRENITGILLLDKPSGITSNLALQKAKRLFHAAKVGHTGSLDPLASGMLPLCFGEATKFCSFFLASDKSYEAVMKLGSMTTTGDSDGEVIATKPVVGITLEKIQAALQAFLGKQQQIPPMFSALKHQGQPLYKLARQGKTIERQPREVIIHHLSCEGVTEEEGIEIRLKVSCSKGTYIRTLVEDLGHYLGCLAHVVALRRLWVAPFQSFNMITLPALQEISPPDRLGSLLAVEQALSLLLPSIELTSTQVLALRHGQQIPFATPLLGTVVLRGTQSGFLGIGEVLANGFIAPRRLLQEKSSSLWQRLPMAQES